MPKSKHTQEQRTEAVTAYRAATTAAERKQVLAKHKVSYQTLRAWEKRGNGNGQHKTRRKPQRVQQNPAAKLQNIVDWAVHGWQHGAIDSDEAMQIVARASQD